MDLWVFLHGTGSLPGAGTTSVLDGYFQGVITEIGTDSLGLKFLQHVSAAGTRKNVDYQQNGVYALPQHRKHRYSHQCNWTSK